MNVKLRKGTWLERLHIEDGAICAPNWIYRTAHTPSDDDHHLKGCVKMTDFPPVLSPSAGSGKTGGESRSVKKAGVKQARRWCPVLSETSAGGEGNGTEPLVYYPEGLDTLVDSMNDEGMEEIDFVLQPWGFCFENELLTVASLPNNRVDEPEEKTVSLRGASGSAGLESTGRFQLKNGSDESNASDRQHETQPLDDYQEWVQQKTETASKIQSLAVLASIFICIVVVVAVFGQILSHAGSMIGRARPTNQQVHHRRSSAKKDLGADPTGEKKTVTFMVDEEQSREDSQQGSDTGSYSELSMSEDSE